MLLFFRLQLELGLFSFDFMTYRALTGFTFSFSYYFNYGNLNRIVPGSWLDAGYTRGLAGRPGQKLVERRHGPHRAAPCRHLAGWPACTEEVSVGTINLWLRRRAPVGDLLAAARASFPTLVLCVAAASGPVPSRRRRRSAPLMC